MKTLSTNDEAILKHTARYRLTLPTILAQARLSAKMDVPTAKAALDRLVSEGWLAQAPLNPGYGDEPYYHLSRKGARHLGHDAQFGEPLPRDLRIESFAIATFCCGGKQFRPLLTKKEFQEKFGSLWFPGQPVRYYLEREEEGRSAKLAFLKIDRDGEGRWDRLIDACVRFQQQRTDTRKVAPANRPKVEAFADLVRRGQFQFTVLTALPEKKRAIEVALEQRAAANELVPPMQVHVVPGLFSLLFPEIRVPDAP